MKQRLLTLCLALTTVSVSALAESYGIFVGGVEVTSSNCNNVTGGDIKAYSTSVNGGQPKVTFVKGSGSTPSKLTLWNVKIDRTGNNNRAIHNRDCANLVIVFEGENFLRTTNATAIRIAQNTTIQGQRDSNRKMRTTVISTKENAVRVVSGKKLTIQYGFFNLTADNDDCFDSEDSPELVLESTVVTATSKSTSNDNSYALKNYKSLSIANSTVTLTGYKKTVSGLRHITLGDGQEDMLTPGIGVGYGKPDITDDYYVVFLAFEWVEKGIARYLEEDIPVVKFQMSPKISERFPDANFRSYISSDVDFKSEDVFTKGDGYLASWERLGQKEINVQGKSISDLTGIELFEDLNLLYCDHNSLKSLDVSNNTALTELNCSGNSLTSLDLSKNTALKELKCNGNNLIYLNVSSNTALEELYCYDNSLKSLDVSNNTALTELDCSGNSLKSLDVSNNKALTTLRCFGNQISGAAMTNLVNSLPTRPDNDGNFIVYDYQNEGNILTPDQVKVAEDKGWAVKKLNNYGNVVNYAGEEAIAIDATNFPDDNFRKIVAAKDINTFGDNYLSVEEMDAVWMLDVENKGIADLTGVGNFPNLIALLCSGNTLTNLDVSKNTKLVGLDCSNNRLTALNFSKNTVLSEVLCYGNNIKGGAMTSLVNSLHQIDDGSLCVIEEGASNDNVITKGQVEIAKKKGWNVFKKDGSNIIDYEGASFESIAINEKNFPDESFRYYLLNHTDFGKDAVLTEAEILAITELEGLEYDRGIENLKGIEYFTALTNLDCPYISLKSLDVSKNTALTWLRCWSNDIKSLDFSKNTALKELYCYYDNLQSLDVSKNAALTYLVCDYNSLKSLDVSNNTALVQLDCSDNIMKYLDVSKNTALESLDCSENSLKSLDVSKNTALKSLNCSYNSLITLDVSKNTALTYLSCSGNQISGEAMTKLVNSLPTLPSGTEGLFYVCNDKAEIDNIITPAQVNIAKGKRWTVKKLGYNSIMDYAGFGDVNGDGKIDQNDLDTIVKIIMGKKPEDLYLGEFAGDLNMDGKTDAADIVVMVNILKALGVK